MVEELGAAKYHGRDLEDSDDESEVVLVEQDLNERIILALEKYREDQTKYGCFSIRLVFK
jgi:U3 small nucleolar RNA-associated protein 14